MNGMGTSEECAAAAALAFRHICDVWLFTLFAIFLLSREASNSILHFLADIFDLANSSVGEQFIPIRDSVIIPRGASITRILVASLTGALLKSRVDVNNVKGCDSWGTAHMMLKFHGVESILRIEVV
ncbi:hypothetical protein JHK85_001397 [Glycine max]|nr:hypothetical protein JHK85_001397 [Glycine max]